MKPVHEMNHATSVPSPRQRTASGLWRFLLMLGGVAALAWIGDWLMLVAIVALGFAIALVRQRGVPPVIAVGITYQWLQVTAGLFYYGVTGRTSPTIGDVDVRPMVLLGLSSIVTLSLGIAIGLRLRRDTRKERRSGLPLTAWRLFTLYCGMVAVYGALVLLAFRLPQVTQLVLALSYVRIAIFFLLLRRLVFPVPRWNMFLLLLLLEVTLSLTGFFAEFRQPLAVATIILLEAASRGVAGFRVRQVVVFGAVVVLALSLSVVWTAVKPQYRRALRNNELAGQEAKARYLVQLVSRWASVSRQQQMEAADALADRVWQVYYPALALERVPDVVPHTNGTLLGDALLRLVMPRLFFPDKDALDSDSEKVRTYAGVSVAGQEQQTNFAFGYVAEAFVDFGIPIMFVPILFYGIAVGVVAARISRATRHQDLGAAILAVVGWLSLATYESSWAYMLGRFVTIAVVLVGLGAVVDRAFWRRKPASLHQRGLPPQVTRPGAEASTTP